MSDLEVTGKQVTETFLPGEQPVASQAEFRIDNLSAQPRSCVLRSCTFITDHTRVPMYQWHVYVGDQPVSAPLTVPARAQLDIRVTFPFRVVQLRPGLTHAVELVVECDGREQVARTELDLVQEF